nr:PREDICTED: gibberellin-regulated protein 11-like [Daucus carota subsp. sativus]
MAAFSRAFALLLLLIFITDFQQIAGLMNGPVAPPAINCTASCDTRCSETKRPNLCKRACGSCCGKCKCVPPGTSGNYEACPCYFNLKTHNNTRKCP